MALALRYPKTVYPRMPKALPKIEQYPLYSLYCNGVDNYLYIPFNWSVLQNGFTIMLWVKPNAYANMDVLRHGTAPQGIISYFAIYYNNTYKRFEFAWRSTDTSEGTYPFPPANTATEPRWYNIVWAWDVSYSYVYQDGILRVKVADTRSGKGIAFTDIYLAMKLYSSYLNGYIAPFLIYTRPLSPAEIKHNIFNPLNPVRDGLVVWLPMLEGYGTTVKDYSGYGNNGTIYGATWKELALYEIPAGAGV